jgi:predicted ATPase
MSSLNRLTLQGFKSIRETDLTLGPLNVLIGANGAGKSNLLSFFRMLNALAEGNLQLFVGKQGGANALLHYGRKQTRELTAKMYFDVAGGKNTYAMTLVAVAPDDLMFSDEEVTHEKTRGAPKQYVLGGGHRESRLDDAIVQDNKTAQTVKWNLDRWRFVHFHDTSADAALKQRGPIGDNRFLRANGEFEAILFSSPQAIAHVLLNATHLARLQQIAASVRSPEEINDGPATHPSSRITDLFPGYQKPLHGPQIAERIGLPTIRAKCGRFHAWLAKLEAL